MRLLPAGIAFFKCNSDELAARSHARLWKELLKGSFHWVLRNVETRPNFFIAEALTVQEIVRGAAKITGRAGARGLNLVASTYSKAVSRAQPTLCKNL